MKVRNLMTAYPLTIAPDAPIRDAVELMIRARVRALPVVESGQFVGIVTERDLRSALGVDVSFSSLDETEDLPTQELVADWMTVGALTVGPDSDVSEACELFVEHKVGSLPVVDDDGVCIGILTVIDVLRTARILFEDLDDEEELEVL